MEEVTLIGRNWNAVRDEIGAGNGQLVTFFPKEESVEIVVNEMVYVVNVSGQILEIYFKGEKK